MHQADQAERLEFYKWVVTHSAFELAENILMEIRNWDRGEIPHWKQTAAWASFFISYAKPFRQQPQKKGVIHSLRVPRTFVPHAFTGLHDELMKARDKMSAHTDFADFLSDQGHLLNGAIAVVNAKGVLQFGMRGVAPLPGMITILYMLQNLKALAREETDKIWSVWASDCPLPPNSCWDVNVGTGSNDVFIPSRLTVDPTENEFSTRMGKTSSSA